MTGYSVFLIYQAIKLHFTSDSYDYFKYQGKYRCSESKFESRRDKFSFVKLGRKYGNEEDLKFFLAANFLIKPKAWVGELNTDAAHESYLQRRKIKESLEYMVIQELSAIDITNRDTLRESMKVQNGEHPALLLHMMRGDISPETLIGIDTLTGCLDEWSQALTDTIIYPPLKLRLRRYAPFLNVDRKSLAHSLVQKWSTK